MNDAVDQLHVTNQAFEIEGVEADQACRRIQQLVVQHEGDVELRIAWQMEAGAFIAGVELVEHELEAHQALVRVLGGVFDAVIVIPQGAQGLPYVAVRLKVKGKSCLLRGVVVIKVLPTEEPATGPAVALRSRVEVVQVGRHLRDAEATVLVLRWQLVEPANHPRLLIAGDNGRSGKDRHVAGSRSALVESPDGLCRNSRI